MTEDGAVRRTDRWRGLGAAALLSGALGLFTRTPALLGVAALGVALLAYGRVMAPPPASLALTRTVDVPDPDPGEAVRVTLRVENVGGRTIPELRLVDGVPSALAVTDGAAGRGTSLRPGGTATLSYTVTAGTRPHEFRPATAVLRDVAGVAERRVTLEASGATAVGRRTPLDDGETVPLRAETARFAGRRTVEGSGDGLTFRTIREYRRGDPPGRIDWRRRARGGELATVEFHPERSLPVVLVVDTRPAAAVASAPDAAGAIDRSLTAAATLYGGFRDADHQVGIATLGPDREWLSPGSGRVHDRRVRELLFDPTIRPTADGDGAGADGANPGSRSADGARAWLRDRLPATAEVLVVTPACDDGVASLIRQLQAGGTSVGVVSPDPTADDTAGRTLARLERDERLAALRSRGVPVVELGPEEAIERALATAGWSR